jgi:subtilisin family serine protease
MGPDLWELFEYGEADDEVAAIIRLGHFGTVPQGVRIIAQFEDIITVRLSRRDIPKISGAPEVAGMSAGDTYLGPDLELNAAEILDVTSPIPTDTRRPEGLGMTGRGIVVGVVDWGFDFAHPDFRKEDGSSRIVALWDQRGGKRANSPLPFSYGVVHTREDINLALKQADPYAALKYHPADADTGFGCHGTHVASIAAGSGGECSPTGIAPEADLVLVHNAPWDGLESGKLGDSVTLLEGIEFISQTAAAKPWVVNLSMGRHGEQHDGSTLVELGLDAAVRSVPGRAVVLSTGNYFNKHIHASGQLRPTEERTIAWVINEGTPTDYNQLEVWYSWQDKFEVSIRSPDGTITAQARLGEKVKLLSGGKEVGNVYHRAQEPNTLDHHITIFLYKTAPAGEWDVTISGTDVIHGDYHAWIEREVSCPACQSHFKPEDADPRSTTGTICNGRRTIAVGAYNAHDSQHSIGPFSSVGPTRDGRLKPDLCAPGVSVLAARSAPRKDADQVSRCTRMTGTSMAAPHVTGTVALMFQAAVNPLRIEETHNLLLGNAERVIVADEDPDRIGIGFLDIEGAVEAAGGADRSNRTFKPVLANRAPAKSAFKGASTHKNGKPRGEAAENLAERNDIGLMLVAGAAGEVEMPSHNRNPSAVTSPVEMFSEAIESESLRGSSRTDARPSVGESEGMGDLAELADQLVAGKASYSSAPSVLHESLASQGRSEALTMPGSHRPASPAEIFDALVYAPDRELGCWLAKHFEIVGAPGTSLDRELRAGDVLVRRGDGDYGHVAVMASPALRTADAVLAAGGTCERNRSGHYVRVIEGGAIPHTSADDFSRRLVDDRGQIPKDQLIVRPLSRGTEQERIDATGLLLGMSLANASRPATAAPQINVSTGGGKDPGGGEGESEADSLSTMEALWPSFSHRGFAADTGEDFARFKGAAAPGEFNSPEHFTLGLALQRMVDGWAKSGLISGGCFVLDSDEDGITLPLSQWSFILPDRNRPEDPYPMPAFLDPRAYGGAHWHWIVPDAQRDSSSTFWTPASLANAVRTGKAATLSIGDIVMMSGDLIGDFADFSAAAGSDWRARPVNLAKGLAASEPFAMSGARVMQFGRKGREAVHDIELLMRSTSDYAGLQKEVVSSDKIWTAVRSVIAFLRKVRGPSGCSELTVLSRLMRHEDITLKNIALVAPWLTQRDYTDVISSVREAGFDDLSKPTTPINSDLFQMVVSNGWYAELAMSNEKHFYPDNWKTFEKAHAQALAIIEQQASPSAFPAQIAPIPAGAIAQTAYGLHFLSDGFASGHMRTPRAKLSKSGSLLSGVMHDFDNTIGLLVENGFHQIWRAFGDGHLEVRLVPSNSRLNINRERAISAMAVAMKQLHYHAQRFFGDSRHPEFQGVLGRTRGTARGLLHDDLVKDSDPGDGSGRDVWLRMDSGAKINFLKKHQPLPLPENSAWKSGTGNHPPLVALDASGSPSIDPHHNYFIGETLLKGKLYELQLNDDDKIDFTKEALVALLTPDAAISWLGVKETWLNEIFKRVRIDRNIAGRALRWKMLPSGLP